jgi:hypothetical protein
VANLPSSLRLLQKAWVREGRDHIDAQRPVRNGALDLIKWLALVTMVIDHLRYVWPDLAWVFAPGRLSFPLFCLAIAANVAKAKPAQTFPDNDARYLLWLLAFSFISEPPYQLFLPNASSLNIFPTLAFGLVIAWGVHHQWRFAKASAIAACCVAYLLSEPLMYGFLGTLIPAALVLAIKHRGGWWLLPSVLCVVINASRPLLVGVSELRLYPTLALGIVFAAPLLGLWLLTLKLPMRIWPVKRWAYAFYPVHLLVLQMLWMAN